MKSSIQTRYLAFLILKDIFEKKITLQLAFTKCKALSDMDAADAKFVRLLVSTVLRRYGQAKEILKSYLKKKLSGKNKDVELILLLAVVQLKFLKTAPHAAVDTSVELTKIAKKKYLSGFVNAVLHSISKAGETPLPDVLLNIPDWLLKRWFSYYGKEKTRAFVETFYTEPFLDISAKKENAFWAEKLGGTLLENGTIRCRFTENVPQMIGFEEGAWWVQEASAALPAELFTNVNKKFGADLCAAPGGKTAQLVAKGATLDAYDISPKRLERLSENLKRLDMQEKVNVICQDVLTIEPIEKYDFILLDAPCSATGTVKRHPDLYFLRTEADVDRIVELQRSLLEHSFKLLKKGGELVYATCSLDVAENEGLVQSFLKDHIEIERIPLQKEFLKPFLNEFGAVQVLPTMSRIQDGFYAVLLKKR